MQSGVSPQPRPLPSAARNASIPEAQARWQRGRSGGVSQGAAELGQACALLGVRPRGGQIPQLLWACGLHRLVEKEAGQGGWEGSESGSNWAAASSHRLQRHRAGGSWLAPTQRSPRTHNPCTHLHQFGQVFVFLVVPMVLEGLQARPGGKSEVGSSSEMPQAPSVTYTACADCLVAAVHSIPTHPWPSPSHLHDHCQHQAASKKPHLPALALLAASISRCSAAQSPWRAAATAASRRASSSACSSLECCGQAAGRGAEARIEAAALAEAAGRAAMLRHALLVPAAAPHNGPGSAARSPLRTCAPPAPSSSP